MDFIVITLLVVIVAVAVLFILGSFVNIFRSDKKPQSDATDKLLWLGLGVLLGIHLFD